MVQSIFFNNTRSRNEQKLIEDLVEEAISIYAVEGYYVPRTIENFDKLYGADVVSQYNAAYLTGFYVKAVDNMSAQSEFLSKFNIEIRDRIILCVGVRSFQDDVGQIANIERPLESDLIWLPFANRMVVVKYVDFKPVFFQMGTIQFYDLSCEMFEYSSEVFNTGVPEIDAIQTLYTTNELLANGSVNPSFNLDNQNALSDISDITTEGNTFIDFTETNPFSENPTLP